MNSWSGIRVLFASLPRLSRNNLILQSTVGDRLSTINDQPSGASFIRGRSEFDRNGTGINSRRQAEHLRWVVLGGAVIYETGRRRSRAISLAFSNISITWARLLRVTAAVVWPAAMGFRIGLLRRHHELVKPPD